MGRALLTGVTGTLGTALQPRLREAGHDVRAASRSPPHERVWDASTERVGDASTERVGNASTGRATDARTPTPRDDDSRAGQGGDLEWVELDLADGTGLERAVEGVDVVVHAASAPRGDSKTVDVEGTEALCEAAAAAGVSHLCYVSIVGVDEIPYSYYEHKLAAERHVEASSVPSTIVRITQFHEFVYELLGALGRLPVWPLPTKFRLQPIDVGEAADAIVELVEGEPVGRAAPVGGPEVRTAGELARAYREARSSRRPIVRLPIPGSVAAGFRSGAACCPDRAVGRCTWEQWLNRRLHPDATEVSER